MALVLLLDSLTVLKYFFDKQEIVNDYSFKNEVKDITYSSILGVLEVLICLLLETIYDLYYELKRYVNKEGYLKRQIYV